MKNLKFKKYKSKIGLVVPLIFLIITGAFLSVWLMPDGFANSDSLAIRIAISVLFGIITLVFSWCVFNSYYVITDVSIVCISGPFKSRIPFERIVSFKERKSILSSFCLSIDRISIYTGKGFFNRFDIAPKEKQEFINELTSKVNVERR